MFKLPFLSKLKTKQKLFLGLFLKEEEGIALLLAKNGQNTVEIKDRLQFSYTNGWDNLSEDIDEVLYKLESSHRVELSKTILFVYSHLVDERSGNIRNLYLSRIKELIKNLELDALGYIECIEAVSFYLEDKDRIPLNSVLLELDKTKFSIFLYKGGKRVFKTTVNRTDSIVDDFLLAIEGMGKERLLLPSRVVIYDSDNIDDAASKIIGHRFDGNTFIQIPKIEILKEDEVINGLIKVFAGQEKARVVDEQTQESNQFGFVVGEENEFHKERTLVEEVVRKPGFSLPFKLPKFTLPKINLSFIKGRVVLIIGIFIIVFSLFLNEYFFHKARLIVYLPTQPIEKNLNESIEYEVSSSSALISDSLTTTGKKEVGDKAKGTLTIHNFDDKERTFSKGTTVEASGMKYILDNDIKVASSSLANDGSAKLPGKANVSITSQNIGPEANLSKGSRFKIDDLSSSVYFGINEASLSGGSKKDIRTVSSADMSNLDKNVLDRSLKQAKAPTLSKDKVILDELSKTSIVSAKYSKEVGEESEKISVEAKTSTTYYAYDRKKLTNLLKEELEKDAKKGFIINPNNLFYKIEKVVINKDNLDLKIIAKTKALPVIDDSELLKKISGKNQDKLKEILKNEFGVIAYDIVISDPLRILKNFIPFFKKNITLSISGT